MRQGAYLGQGAYFFFEKQPNAQNKTFKNGTITEAVTVTNIR